ncbi:cell division protein FtsQ/DivIB [Solimonas marina]|uniref:Cell division protein FtsQ n=1 Tax=Solimonas marina TaxID=2714601 RepID=A0A969WAC8_9GAMM|nr:cell division protein FtsQ/DivIB [Solimonas marina]NKF22933.1 FtsQ-type POTRA domain-containing protein [Solimonas marina]
MTMTADMLDDSPSPMRRYLMLGAGAVVLIALLVAGWGAMTVGTRTPVERLQIEGQLQRLKTSDIEAVLRPLIDRQFGQLDLEAAKQAVEALPWTSHASVERVWPATVRVRVWERVPFARWGDKSLLDTDSRPFTPSASDIPDGLPQLSGPDGKEAEVADMFRVLREKLANSSFALQSLTQDARGEWAATTVDGIGLHFGRTDPTTKIDTLLGPAERALKNRMNEVNYVDLRYTNGFAVGWKDPAAAKKAKEGR